MKILHFMVDEKFIPFVQKTFEEAFPGRNSFRVLGNPRRPRFMLPGPNARILKESYWTSDAVTEELERNDVLVIHYMTSQFIEGIRRAPDRVLVCWNGWGSDYMYLLEPFLGRTLLTDTQHLMAELDRERQRWHRRAMTLGRKFLDEPDKLGPYLRRKLRGGRVGDTRAIREVGGKIDLVSVCPEEMEMFRRAMPDFRGEFHRFFNYSAEETLAVGPERMDGPDLLIGNSATGTNNHLELFDLLAELDLGDRRLITPLSYGDSAYGDAIERIGTRRFGRRFVAIRGYMPLEEYYETIRGCGVVIMNHVRQQGGTTIATALFKGAKVFIRAENPAFEFYGKLGVRLFSVQHDLVGAEEPFAPLARDVMTEHRRLMVEYWGHKAAIDAALALRNHAARKQESQESMD